MASVTVDVDIDEFDDDEVVSEALSRGYRVTITPEQMQKFHKWEREKIETLKAEIAEDRLADDDLAEIRDCLKRRQYADALSLVENLLFPKFNSRTECEEKYARARAHVASKGA